MAKKSKYYVRPDGLHEAIRTINGKRVAFRGKTDREVDRKILEYKEEKAKGRPFPVVAEEWYGEHEKEIGVSAYRVYGFALRRLMKAFPMPCSEIRPMDVKRYLTNFERKGYAKGTVQIELTVLKQIFAHAVLCGDIEVSPASEVKKSKGLPSKKRSALTEEQEALVEQCRTGDWWLLGLMLLYTGCRRGELLALEWKDIDRKAGVIHITKKLNYAYGSTPHLDDFLKSANGLRDVPLLKPLADVLPTNRVGKVFANEQGEYLKSNQIDKAWKQYCRDAGLVEIEEIDGETIEAFPITPHCLRHSFATICYEAGIDPKSAAAFMGDTEDVVRTVYTDLRNAKHTTSADKLNDYVTNRHSAKEA